LEAQLAKQTGSAELVRIQQEQKCKSLEDKIRAMAVQLSSKEEQVFGIKKDLNDKSLKVQLLENQFKSLNSDLEKARVAVNDLTKKAEQAEKALKLKNHEFSVLYQKNKEEFRRHQEKEKVSEGNANALRVEMQEIRSSKEMLMAKFQEKSNSLTLAQKQAIRLTGEVKDLESFRTEHTNKMDGYKRNLQEKSRALTNAQQQVDRLKGKVKTLENGHFEQVRNLEEYKAKFEETSNALTNAAQKVDKLNGKVKDLESDNIEQTKKAEKSKETVRKLAAEILEKRIAVERLQAQAVDLEKANHVCTKRASAFKLALEERIKELELRLGALNREPQRQNSDEGQANRDVLLKAQENLIAVKADNSSLNIKLKEIEKRRKEEEDDHVAEVEGYEEAIREKNETIRDLNEKVKTLKEKQAALPTCG